MSKHRDIEEIKSDLEDAENSYRDNCAEVCHFEMLRDEAKGYVDEYKAELEEALRVQDE